MQYAESITFDAKMCRLQILTGEGPLGQLQLELGLPAWGVDLLVLGTIAYSVIGGLNPKSPTFSEANQRDVRKRGPGVQRALLLDDHPSNRGSA